MYATSCASVIPDPMMTDRANKKFKIYSKDLETMAASGTTRMFHKNKGSGKNGMNLITNQNHQQTYSKRGGPQSGSRGCMTPRPVRPEFN
jgi:hypothetical protein